MRRSAERKPPLPGGERVGVRGFGVDAKTDTNRALPAPSKYRR
jgi:hypothetical protein